MIYRSMTGNDMSVLLGITPSGRIRLSGMVCDLILRPAGRLNKRRVSRRIDSRFQAECTYYIPAAYRVNKIIRLDAPGE
jgi:hypothetical protein